MTTSRRIPVARRLIALGFAAFALAHAAPDARAESTLRPGDTVEIKIAGVPQEDVVQVSHTYEVDGSGMLNLPYIGKIQAQGLSASQVQSAIENRYRREQIYTNPTVTIVMLAGSRFVNVGGEVRTPQRVPYTADLTLLSAINGAGGFSPYANQRKIVLMRGDRQTVHDAKEIRKNPALDVKLLPGDRIDVPQSFF